MLIRRRYGPAALVSFACGLALLGGVLQTDVASASSPCRDDPTVVLSNGTIVAMSEDIYDTARDVTKVSYQLHIPRGVSVKSVSFTGDVSASLQTLSVVADENTGSYDAFVDVFTTTPHISVTAYMSATSPNGSATVSSPTNGHSGQSLHSYLHF